MGFKQSDVDKLLADTGRHCCICGILHNIQVHHIIPKEDGGSDDIENAIPLCPNCHDKVHIKYSKGRTTRAYTPNELKLHRERTIRSVQDGVWAQLRQANPTTWATLIAKGGSDLTGFSKRTLHDVQLLSQKEEELFRKILNQFWMIDHRFIHLFTEDTERMYLNEVTGLSALQILTSCGLLIDDHFEFVERIVWEALYQDTFLFAIAKAGLGSTQVRAKILTPTGFDLLKTIELEPDEEYVKVLANSLAEEVLIRPFKQNPNTGRLSVDFTYCMRANCTLLPIRPRNPQVLF